VGFTEFFFSSPKLDVIETPVLIDAATTTCHSVRLRISALSTSDLDAVSRDLDSLCADVVRTHTIDANKYGDTISGLTDMQVSQLQLPIIL